MLAMAALAAGCLNVRTENPSFDATVAEAREALEAMENDPVTLDRPVVVLSGIFDPGLMARSLARRLEAAVGDDRVIHVAFPGAWSFDACRKRAIEAVDEAFPNDDPEWTTEVDVVGVSMGGIVARYAATALETDDWEPQARRLRIARLFTLGSPHQGASMAALPTPDPRARAMRAESEFMKRLDEAAEDEAYTLYPYVRLSDRMVGAHNAAPPGETPIWVPNRPLRPAHLTVAADPRIVADIARRLRGEEPLAAEPREPLP